MKKNLLIAVLACTNLAAIAFLYRPELAPAWLHFGVSRELSDLRERLDAARMQARRLEAAELAEKAALAKAIASQSQGAPAAAGADPDGSSAGGAPRFSAAALIDKLLSDPVASRYALAAMKMGQWSRYGPLFSALKLPPAQLTDLRNLLAKRDAALVDAANLSKQAGVPVDPSLVDKINADFGTAATKLLGPKQAALATASVEQPAAWSEVSDIQTRLQSMGVPPLSAPQMAATLHVVGPTLTPLPSTTDSSVISSVIQSEQQNKANVLGSLAGVLSPAQLNVVQGRLNDNILATRMFYYAQSNGAAAAPARR